MSLEIWGKKTLTLLCSEKPEQSGRIERETKF
jgi:hypothetical protein